MAYTPQIDGTAALKALAETTKEVSGTAGQATGEVIKFPGAAAQATTSNGTTFLTALKSLTGTAGAAVAGYAGVMVPTGVSVIAAAAAMALGASLGEGWYENNPELWNEIGDRIYNLNPELSQKFYAGGAATWAWLHDGKMYVDEDVIKAAADVLIEYGVLTDNYQAPSTGATGISVIGMNDLVSSNVNNPNKTIESFALSQLPVLMDFINEVCDIGNYITLGLNLNYDGNGYGSISAHVGTGNIDMSNKILRSAGYGQYEFWCDNSELYNTYNLYMNYYNGIYRDRSYQVGHAYGSNVTGYLPFDYTHDGSVLGVGSLNYPSIAKQRNATILDDISNFDTVFADWVANRTKRIADWDMDPDTGDITITEQPVLPIEFPLSDPMQDPLKRHREEPGQEPEPYPESDPEADPAKRVKNKPQNDVQNGDDDDPLIDDNPKDYNDPIEHIFEDPTVTPNIPTPPTVPTGITPTITVPEGSAQALFTVYNPTQAELDTFGGWLWSSNFLDNLVKIIENPIDCIISLKKIFCTPSTGGSGTIYCGHLASSASAAIVTEQYKEVDLGSIDIGEHFYDATDYAPYTSISCFLPFIGMVELSPYDCVKATMNIKYVIDCYNGEFMALIKLTKDEYEGITYTYSGNCSVEYPITGSNHAALALSAAVTGVTAMASGGLSLAGLAGMAGSLGGQQSVNGQMSGNAGACGGKTPYVIIKRMIPKSAISYNNYYGYPTSKLMTIGECSGYTRAKAVITNGIVGASDAEIEEIENILKDGIIV